MLSAFCDIATSEKDGHELSRDSASEPGSGPARAEAARPTIERMTAVFILKDLGACEVDE